MAKKSVDLAAAKAKKQRTILIVCGVLLLAVAGLQGTKLMKKGGQSDATSTTATDTNGTETTGASGTTGAAPVVTSSALPMEGSAVVAGVALPKGVAIRVAPSQLASFTLFDVKDPFVQQAGEEPSGSEGGTTAPSAPPSGSESASGNSSESASGSSAAAPSASSSDPTPAPPPVVYATINLDGKPQQVEAKQKFPEADPLFVLLSVAKKQARIGVAGGSFDDGQAVILKLGKKVTLVNTATGVRYVLKLVYTGASPEAIEGFTTTGASQAAASSTANASTSAAP